ncbi:YqaJ viral recombinase family protein [Rhodococcus erythropolis]|uniref:lambda exonuclease family protein n=1 Tax=Rhodococcus erythropolis TaxID=1833 RepID=UPI00294907CF|nr:YqaJ viral recombinase family protein [Rhodococcus erythropolis]MDV6273953.1 YqaJ viral recombinase family protein [Rhodococcus erythropolis]
MTAPTLIELPELEQGTDDWHDQRRGIVTASVVGNLVTSRSLTAIDYDCPACDAPADDPCRSKVKAGAIIKTLHPERAEAARQSDSRTILEVASNDTSRGLTALLVAERITGWTDPTFVSDDMMRGIEDEPRARDKYAEHFNVPMREIGFMIREDRGVKLGYSPDGLVGDDGLIEVKSRKQKKQLETVLSGEPPAENMAQLQCGLLVSGRKWIDYISYSGGMHLWVTRVFPDQRWFDAITAAVSAFEANSAEMIRVYEESVVGFPMTERVFTEMEFE